MNKYAVIAVGGKQYTVREGEVLEVQKLASSESKVEFDQVLLVVDGDNVQVGTPAIADLIVHGTFVENKKGDKVQVFKYKSKSKYRKLNGARQMYSYVKIDSIGTARPKAAAARQETAAPKTEKKAAAKPAVKKTPAKKSAVK
jgi:large subunit ribosomal protein L21